MGVAARYASGPIWILLAALLYLSPAGPSLHLPSLFLFGVLAVAWFGGIGPGLVSAVLATLALPYLAVTNHQLLGGFLDLPCFVAFFAGGLVAGWASSRRAKLLRDQERHARAMDASDDGFWDWNLADDTIYTSPRLLEIFGFAPATTFAGHDDFVAKLPFHSDERPLLMKALADHFAGKTAHHDIEARFVRRGETRWVQLAGLAARDPHGTVVRWTGTARDVTGRKRAEEALRESEERYELAMAASESGYWDWHIPTDRFFGSQRANVLTGIPAETQWTTRGDYRARTKMLPEDFERWEAAREALFAGTGERLAMEVRYTVRGEIRWHMLQAICRRDDAGKVIRWAGSTTDITERKQAEEGLKAVEQKLRQAQRVEAMGVLAGGIAHDFNNILGAILGYGEMALRDAPEGSRLARDVGSIMIAGERGRALVERVLAFSRSAVGERVPVHVERVVKEALDLVSAKLPPSVTVHTDLRAGRAAVLGDATQVHQVVANLAINAIQAMPAGGTLRVELAAERVDVPRAVTIGEFSTGEYVVLTVADAGAGIAPEILDRIFDPFFTTKEVGTGTGLGLSLVHGIVTELGGAIDVTSSLGIGSTFTVYLPRSGDAAEPGDQEGAPLPGGTGQCILIVDDEEPLVELASRILADLGYVPIGFTSSTSALAAFRADPGRFDALITDERMPEMSGSALIREVRGLRSSIPIVLMSGYLAATPGKARESDLVDVPGTTSAAASAIGADEVLQKPLSARDLAASLARVLPLHRLAER